MIKQTAGNSMTLGGAPASKILWESLKKALLEATIRSGGSIVNEGESAEGAVLVGLRGRGDCTDRTSVWTKGANIDAIRSDPQLQEAMRQQEMVEVRSAPFNPLSNWNI